MAELPRGTVTFLFTDIEGSTRLLGDLGDRYADALGEHRRVLREAFRAHGGAEVDTQADAFFYAFQQPRDAVAAAAEAQEALAGGPILVRMGLHTGEPQLTEEGYVGLDVHAGARVAACAHGGQVVLSKRTRELAGDGFAFRDLGEHRLKDLEEPVWLYQLGTLSFPPLKSLSNTNLPIPASSFLGRETELAEAHALLQNTRLLTVSGPGGTGKTRFAIELASRQLEDFPNGVFWVPLAPLRDPALVPEEAARVIGAKDGLPAHIADKRLLILLDNFEQVVDAAPVLGDLLRACPNLRLLVTSRETLRVEGESEYALPPLVEDEGVALFSVRARVEPSAAVRELCRHLDGLPLAIELAAARAKVLAPEDLLPRLSERLDLLKGGRDAESRHATLRATIAWSYELLGDDERQLFARLGVFAGGWTLGAAEAVCGADLDTLEALLDKSLVRRTDARYWMLETIREFALERLAERPDRDEAVRRRTEYFLHLAEQAYPHLSGPDQGDWLERLDPDHDNIRAAIAHTRETGDREAELRLAAAVAPLRVRRGYYAEALSSLRRVISSPGPPRVRSTAFHLAGWTASLQGRNEDAEILLREGLALAREVGDLQLMARLLLTLAGIVSDRDEQEAQELYDELLAFVEQHPEERFPDAFVNLGDFALRRRDYEGALVFSARSIELAKEADDPWPLALALSNHGLALLGLGRGEDSMGDFREALRAMQRTQDAHGEAMTLAIMGVVSAEVGDMERAVRLLAFGQRRLEELEAAFTGLERSLHERAVGRVRRECPDFEAEWEGGRAMTQEEAVAEALEQTPTERPSPAGSTSSSRGTV